MMYKKYFRNIILYLCISILLFSNCIFAVSLDNDKSLHSSNIIENSSKDSRIGPVPLQFNDIVAVTGDSYAGIFCQFEDMKSFKLMEYAIAGRTVLQNEGVMTEAAIAPGKILIISIGVNDHAKYTPPYAFEATLRRILNYTLLSNKIVFVHSYVDYPISNNVPSQYKISQYDDVLKRLANDYNNMHYIDMNMYSTNNYILPDNIHYGQAFYDILYNKILNVLMTIDF